MSCFASMAAELGDEPEGETAATDGALVRLFSGVDADVLGAGPRPLECHLAAFPGALERPLVEVDSVMDRRVFVGPELLPTPFVGAPVSLVNAQLSLRPETHHATFYVAPVFFAFFLSLFLFRFLFLVVIFGSGACCWWGLLALPSFFGR